MIFEFRKNGDVSLMIKPEGTIEQAFFTELFKGDVTVSSVSSANHMGEVILTVKKKEQSRQIVMPG